MTTRCPVDVHPKAAGGRQINNGRWMSDHWPPRAGTMPVAATGPSRRDRRSMARVSGVARLWDLVTGGALLAGYAWLGMLSARLRSVHRRLGAHVCGGSHRHFDPRVSAAEILRRERARQPPDGAAERTQPMPAAGGHRTERKD